MGVDQSFLNYFFTIKKFKILYYYFLTAYKKQLIVRKLIFNTKINKKWEINLCIF